MHNGKIDSYLLLFTIYYLLHKFALDNINIYETDSILDLARCVCVSVAFDVSLIARVCTYIDKSRHFVVASEFIL